LNARESEADTRNSQLFRFQWRFNSAGSTQMHTDAHHQRTSPPHVCVHSLSIDLSPSLSRSRSLRLQSKQVKAKHVIAFQSNYVICAPKEKLELSRIKNQKTQSASMRMCRYILFLSLLCALSLRSKMYKNKNQNHELA
jgi:hypothetical protein